MEHNIRPKISDLQRVGLHYFIDAEHLMTADAEKWSQVLNRSRIHWLVITNPVDRAVPELFIKEVLSRNIEVIINFNLGMRADFDVSSLQTLLEVYGKWGVKYVSLFRMPNQKTAWEHTSWNTVDIVQEHAHQFLEFAQICIQSNIRPIFSPLMPGGDYWDLAFLERSLEIIKQSADPYILKKMLLSALGWFWERDINWGAGGKAKWPKARPFAMPEDSQNQFGFRTYQWYSEIAEKVIGRKLPIIILEAGRSPQEISEEFSLSDGYGNNLSSAVRLLHGKNVFDQNDPQQLFPAIGSEVIACNFYILSAEENKQLEPYRWFTPQGEMLPLGRTALGNENQKKLDQAIGKSGSIRHNFAYQRYIYVDDKLQSQMHTILEGLDPYIKQHKPHLGFSLLDASKAAHLLIITTQKESFQQQHKDLLPQGNITRVVSPDEIKDLMRV